MLCELSFEDLLLLCSVLSDSLRDKRSFASKKFDLLLKLTDYRLSLEPTRNDDDLPY